MGSPDPLIFALQHFCLHDGPGVRSLVFFKGCPLRCPWCQNVESWKPHAELAFKPALCIGCGACGEKCPERALTGAGIREAGRCRMCFSCVEACPSGATVRFGVPKTPGEIVEELRPEFSLHKTSGGGVTFTGGEPTLYPGFASRLARLLRAEGISVAMETCGLFDLEELGPLLSELDLVLFDIKIFDQELHKKTCGGDNAVIRKNLDSLARQARSRGVPFVWPRLPVVPGMTSGEDNIRAWAGFLREVGINFLTLVPYHPMGRVKRRWLGLPDGPELRVPADDELGEIEGVFFAQGIRVFRPGEEDYALKLDGRGR
jgi:glycyl-radical enzyme activating protein